MLALLAASFITQLIPTDTIGHLLNGESGVRGLLVASGAGLLVPGGGVIALPLALLLREAGAGSPQLMAFITSWSIFALHRILAYEIPSVGWHFARLRVSTTVLFPLIVGLSAGYVVKIT